MTTSTRPTNRQAQPFGARRQAGFTLVEVMIAAALSTMVLAAVLSAFLMLGRTGLAASAYSEMDAQVRRGLEVFGEDARRASDIRWNSAQSITFSVVSSGANSTPVTYAYDNDPASATYGVFYRMVGDVSSTAPRLVLVRGVAGDFAFQRFKISQPGVADATATSDLETKRVLVTLRTQRLGVNTPVASQAAISASYILRNKRVTN